MKTRVYITTKTPITSFSHFKTNKISITNTTCYFDFDTRDHETKAIESLLETDDNVVRYVIQEK